MLFKGGLISDSFKGFLSRKINNPTCNKKNDADGSLEDRLERRYKQKATQDGFKFPQPRIYHLQ